MTSWLSLDSVSLSIQRDAVWIVPQSPRGVQTWSLLVRSASPVLVGAALNGEREHPAAPRSPAELAVAARASIDAGAGVLHIHAFGGDGRETIEPAPCARAILAVRAACPGVPVSLSTSAQIEPDPTRRLRLIDAWEVQPDLVTANQGERGILELCQLLRSRGVGIEAGLLCHTDAEVFVRSEVPEYALRVLVEPLDGNSSVACDHAATMESVLSAAGIELPQMHHGDGVASWAVSERGLMRGHDIRTGLEDTGQLSDGSQATDNGAVVSAAVAMILRAGRTVQRPSPRAAPRQQK